MFEWADFLLAFGKVVVGTFSPADVLFYEDTPPDGEVVPDEGCCRRLLRWFVEVFNKRPDWETKVVTVFG